MQKRKKNYSRPIATTSSPSKIQREPVTTTETKKTLPLPQMNQVCDFENTLFTHTNPLLLKKIRTLLQKTNSTQPFPTTPSNTQSLDFTLNTLSIDIPWNTHVIPQQNTVFMFFSLFRCLLDFGFHSQDILCALEKGKHWSSDVILDWVILFFIFALLSC